MASQAATASNDTGSMTTTRAPLPASWAASVAIQRWTSDSSPANVSAAPSTCRRKMRSGIAAAEARIRAVGGQPEEDYPEPSGIFAPLA